MRSVRVRMGMVTVLTGAMLACASAAADSAGELYQIVFLRPNPARPKISDADAERMQTAHMANIHAMADRGLLIAAGPFEDDPPAISGIFIFRDVSSGEAERVAAQDPTVVAHRNTVEVRPWLGPKDLGANYRRLHKENPQTPEGMGIQPFVMLRKTAAWRAGSAAMKGHLLYEALLLRNHSLATAGPTPGNSPAAVNDLGEIMIFNRVPDDDARRLAEADPAVRAGELTAEYHRWWCAAHVLPEE